jgi:hypothetical protein
MKIVVINAIVGKVTLSKYNKIAQNIFIFMFLDLGRINIKSNLRKSRICLKFMFLDGAITDVISIIDIPHAHVTNLYLIQLARHLFQHSNL